MIDLTAIAEESWSGQPDSRHKTKHAVQLAASVQHSTCNKGRMASCTAYYPDTKDAGTAGVVLSPCRRTLKTFTCQQPEHRPSLTG